MTLRTLCLTLVLICFTQVQADLPTYKGHAIAMHGDVKYGPDFKHFEYVNPNAPKGGTVKLASDRGTFDNLNGLILKGVTPYGLGLTGERGPGGVWGRGAVVVEVRFRGNKSGLGRGCCGNLGRLRVVY